MHALITTLPYLTVTLIYLSVAYVYWHHGARTQSESTLKLHTPLIAVGLILHAYLLYGSLFQNGLNLGLTNALSAISWLTVLIYWLTDIKHRLHSLQAFVLPPSALFVLLDGVMPSSHPIPYADQPLFLAHLIIALLAYSLFTFAALHAMLMAVAERSLHNKPTFIKLPDFPPIMPMEILLFRVIAVGFVLLTFTLISGMLFSEQIFHQALKLNHKNIFTIISWLIFGSLLVGRYVHGWRGRTAIGWTLTGFVALMLAYVGSKFVLEFVLHRV